MNLMSTVIIVCACFIAVAVIAVILFILCYPNSPVLVAPRGRVLLPTHEIRGQSQGQAQAQGQGQAQRHLARRHEFPTPDEDPPPYDQPSIQPAIQPANQPANVSRTRIEEMQQQLRLYHQQNAAPVVARNLEARTNLTHAADHSHLFVNDEPTLELQDTTCSVCLDEMNIQYRGKGDTITRANCGHSYHKSCMYGWFRAQIRDGATEIDCPLCRTQTTTLDNYRDGYLQTSHELVRGEDGSIQVSVTYPN